MSDWAKKYDRAAWIILFLCLQVVMHGVRGWKLTFFFAAFSCMGWLFRNAWDGRRV